MSRDILTLRDIMNHDQVTLAPEMSLRGAFEVLTACHVTGAPVVANRLAVGVVSLTDLAEFLPSPPDVPTERADLTTWANWENPGDLLGDDAPLNGFFADSRDDGCADVARQLTTLLWRRPERAR